MKKFTALYRPYIGGPIYETVYDFDNKKLADIPIDIKLEFNNTFESGVVSYEESILDLMYPHFSNDIVRAVIYYNYDTLIILTNLEVIYYDINTKSKEVAGKCIGKFNIKSYIPIGFEKTYLNTRRYFVGFNRVLYDADNDSYLINGEWVQNKTGLKFKEHKGKKPYFALLQIANKAVLVAEDGSYIFI